MLRTEPAPPLNTAPIAELVPLIAGLARLYPTATVRVVASDFPGYAHAVSVTYPNLDTFRLVVTVMGVETEDVKDVDGCASSVAYRFGWSVMVTAPEIGSKHEELPLMEPDDGDGYRPPTDVPSLLRVVDNTVKAHADRLVAYHAARQQALAATFRVGGGFPAAPPYVGPPPPILPPSPPILPPGTTYPAPAAGFPHPR